MLEESAINATDPEGAPSSEAGEHIVSWSVDPDRSKIEFTIRHFMVTKVRGRFTSCEGALTMDEENPQASFIEGTVEIDSLKTGISLRDRNVRSAGFFNAKRFPQMSFRSTRIGPFEGNSFQVYGDLTIKDTTRPVAFDVLDKGDMPPENGRRRRSFDASITLNRKDYGLKWNPLVELGGLLVGDEVNGTIEIQMVQV